MLCTLLCFSRDNQRIAPPPPPPTHTHTLRREKVLRRQFLMVENLVQLQGYDSRTVYSPSREFQCSW